MIGFLANLQGAEKVFKEIEDIVIENNLNYEIFSLVNHLKKIIILIKIK